MDIEEAYKKRKYVLNVNTLIIHKKDCFALGHAKKANLLPVNEIDRRDAKKCFKCFP